MFKHSVFFLILTLLGIGMFIGLKNRLRNEKTYASTTTQDPSSVTVNAFIGEYYYTLFGYASPKALVTLEGMGIYDTTTANQDGYFEFKNRFSPLVPREACLTAQDNMGRITPPNCIPPFPTEYNVVIGPVLISPTVSVNAPNYYQGDEVKLSGQTIPNTDVSFSTFVDENKSITKYLSNIFTIIKPAYAFTFPQFTTKSDSKGNYSLSVPSSNPLFFRLFAQTTFQNSISAQSVKLNLKIYPYWMIIIQFLLILWSVLKSRLLEIIILGELIAITIFFLRRYTHPHVIAKNRSLMIPMLYPLVEEETELMIPQSYPLTIEELSIVKQVEKKLEISH